MASEFIYRRRVQFAETDLAGIVHFSRYFLYMEEAEHAFLRSLGFSVVERDSGIGWPRVEAQCRYLAPLRFEDEIEVLLSVVEKKSKALTYEFRIVKVAPKPQITVAEGRITVVCVAMDKASGTMKATTLPENLAAKIEAK